MSNYIFDIPGQQSYWGLTDILDTDLEKLQFEKTFSEEPLVYNSILDDEPAYHSMLNFPEEEEDSLYADDEDEDDENDTPQQEEEDDRESYKTVDQDNMYYFI